VRAIGAELGVATVVEGSVQRAGDTLRITAQLVRTADGSHIWSKSYDRKQADLFAIQDEIAGAVTEALVGALVPAAKAAIAAGGTTDLDAYDDYARGLQERRRSSYESLVRAEQAMQQAIERDPKYVDAMLGLLDVWRDMLDTGMILRPDFIARTTPWLDRVAALDPDNATLMAYRAEHAREQGREAEAMSLFERAVAAAPADAALRAWYGQFMPGTVDPQVRLEQFDRAVELDPLNAIYHFHRVGVLGRMQRYDESERAALRAAALDPGNVTVLSALADVALLRGDLAGYLVGYLKARRVDPRDHELAAQLALVLDEIGERDAADAWLAEARRLKPGNLPAETAAVRIHFARGQHESALAAALAISSRHDEERRADWVTAMSAGCLAAHELGRTAELRAAMERVAVVPAEFTPQGFEALVGPRYDLRHQFSHVGRLAPCLFEPGAAGAARRDQMLQTIGALQGPDWAQDRNWWFTDGLLRADGARMLEAVLPAPATPDALLDLPRRATMSRWVGIDGDPALKAYVARIEAKHAETRAALPARLAAEGLSLTP
jgi:tetratricopeptide (TPR) repeat protein